MAAAPQTETLQDSILKTLRRVAEKLDLEIDELLDGRPAGDRSHEAELERLDQARAEIEAALHQIENRLAPAALEGRRRAAG